MILVHSPFNNLIWTIQSEQLRCFSESVTHFFWISECCYGNKLQFRSYFCSNICNERNSALRYPGWFTPYFCPLRSINFHFIWVTTSLILKGNFCLSPCWPIYQIFSRNDFKVYSSFMFDLGERGIYTHPSLCSCCAFAKSHEIAPYHRRGKSSSQQGCPLGGEAKIPILRSTK